VYVEERGGKKEKAKMIPSHVVGTHRPIRVKTLCNL
jgi:hypothetical protein